MSSSHILRELEKQFPELCHKSSLINYYMDFEFPEKQVKMELWWQKILKSYLIHSKKLLVTLSQLQKFFYIHGMKPTPLPKLFQHYYVKNIIGTVQPIQPNVEKQNWISSLTGYIFGVKKQKSSIIESTSKIYISQILNITIKKSTKILPQIFIDSHICNYQSFKHLLNAKMDLDQDIQFLIQQLKNQNILKIDFIENQRVVAYSKDRNNYQSDIWIQSEKVKYTLLSKINIFQNKIDKKIQELDSLLKKARQRLQNGGDKEGAKAILKGRKPISQALNNLTLRRELLNDTLHQLQSSQMNNSTVSTLKNSQQLIKQYMIDPSIIDDLVEENRNIQFSQKQIHNKFTGLVEDDEEDVDKMMKQLEMEVQKEKKQNVSKIIRTEVSQKMEIQQNGIKRISTQDYKFKSSNKQIQILEI